MSSRQLTYPAGGLSDTNEDFTGQPAETPAEDDSPVPGSNYNCILESGSIISVTEQYTVQCLTIIGQIEGHYILSPQNKTTKYEHIIPQLAAVEQSEQIDGLLIILNTVGGDVEAGLAIAELGAGMTKPVVSLVLRKSFIARSATMTIHPVRMNGLMLGVPQAFEYFQRMQRRITTFVTDHSSVSPEKYNELALNTDELVMDIGTILDGKDAVDIGLIDSIGTLNDALTALYKMIDKGRGKRKKHPKK